jgi:sporulation protein YlmC with PRC-barrel domain
MKIDLDARVRTQEGEEAGSVHRAILDPRTGEVTGFVVSTGTLLGRDVIVPRQVLEGATRDGDVLRLNVSREELERLPAFAASDYTAPPAGWVPPPGLPYSMAALAWPTQYRYDAQEPAPAAPPELGASINKGAPVYDRNGDDVGTVEELLLDESTGSLRGFVLRAGGMLETALGGGRTLEVDRGYVARVAEGLVHLDADKDDIGRLAEEVRQRAP